MVEWTGRVETLDQLDALFSVARLDRPARSGGGSITADRACGLWSSGFIAGRAVALAVTPEQLGCKTWVPLDPPLATAGAEQVIEPADLAARLVAIRQALGATA